MPLWRILQECRRMHIVFCEILKEMKERMNHMTYIRSQRPEDKRYYLTPIYGKDLERIGIRNDGGGFA